MEEGDSDLYRSPDEPIYIGHCSDQYRSHISTYIASLLDQYETVAPRRDKSCGRVANKFGLRTWL